jgi:hypothetical protein
MNTRTLVSGFAAIMVLAAPVTANAATAIKAQPTSTATKTQTTSQFRGLTGSKLRSCTARLSQKKTGTGKSSMAALVKPAKKY